MAGNFGSRGNKADPAEELKKQQREEMKRIEEERKAKDEADIAAGKLLIHNNQRYAPMPEGFRIAIYSTNGLINKYYEKTLDKIYEAMKEHKKYYDETMEKCHYPVKDIIPTKDIIRRHIFTLEAFLFGWFALDVIDDPDGKDQLWATEHSFDLIQDFIQDVSMKKTPRVLRGV